jgi:photosystem II stability/assembly factor-like uncharacterized protein
MKKFLVLSFLPALIIILQSPSSRLGSLPAEAAIGAWELIGPYGGNVLALARNPSNSSELFSVGLNGQICRTTDGGRTWSLATVLNPRPDYVYDIAFSPSNPDILYLDTYRQGIYKSVDHGAHWAACPYAWDCTAQGSLWVSPSNPNQILAAGKFKSTGALLRSADGGTTWTAKTIAGATPFGNCGVLAVDPTNPNVIYAVASYSTAGPDGPYHSDLYKSSDGGDSWQIVLSNAYVQTIVIDGTNPSRIYAGMTGSIYRSLDGGQSWIKNSGLAGAQRLVIDRNNPQILYSGSNGSFYKSVNAGQAWTLFSEALEGACTGLTVFESQILYASRVGIFRSENGGTTWNASITGMSALNVLAFSVAPSSPNSIYAAAEVQQGFCLMYKSLDAGSTWQSVPLSQSLDLHNDVRVTVSPWDPNTLWILERDLWKSNDGGESWKALTARPVIDDLADMAVSRSDPNRLFVWGRAYSQTDHFFRMDFEKSVDGGTSWTALPITAAKSSATVAAIDPGDEDIIFVGGEVNWTGALFRTQDGGSSWSEIGRTSFGLDSVQAIALDPSSRDRIYIGTAGGFYRSENRGSTWAQTASFPVRSIALHSEDPKEVYAAGSNGVFRSSDLGETWTEMDSHPAGPEINGLQFVSANQTLYIGTLAGLAKQRIILPRIYAPLDFSATTALNRSLSQGETIHVLRWSPNPKNAPTLSYRIYAVDGESYVKMLAQLSPNTREYLVRNASPKKAALYALVAVDGKGREGEPAYATAR